MSEQKTVVEEKHLDAQMAVLGSMLIDSATVGIVMAQAREEDFAGSYRSIFIAIRSLFLRNALVDRLDRLFLHRTMAPAMRKSIVNALNKLDPGEALRRVKLAINLTLASVAYQVQK